MELKQALKQEQKLILTHEMRQSLAILRMTLHEVETYLEDAVVDNPLLELDYSAKNNTGETEDENYQVNVEIRNYSASDGKNEERGRNRDYLENTGTTTEEDFSEVLCEQLLSREGLDDFLYRYCIYLIYCLDEKGYLRFTLQELAVEQKTSLKRMEEALTVVQDLEPTGVGARNLEECLVLQLHKKNKLDMDMKNLLHEGLDLLAKRDYKKIEELLHCKRSRVMELVEAVCKLNPIPSQGYKTTNTIQYQVPEAEIKVVNAEITVELNEHFLPQLIFNKDIETLLHKSQNKYNLAYYNDRYTNAKQLMYCLENRARTIDRILQLLVKTQKDFFLKKGPLVPMTMSKLAADLEVSISTVSRAVQAKTIVCDRKIIQLRNMFSVPIIQGVGSVSRNAIKDKIKGLIAMENKEHPLADEQIEKMLAQDNIKVSRRVIAKYREELGIRSSSKRKR